MKKWLHINAGCILAYLLVQAVFVTGCSETHAPKPGVTNEMVMSPGMSITASTREGIIKIAAGEDFKRSYTWDGETRSVTLWPRWSGGMEAWALTIPVLDST